MLPDLPDIKITIDRLLNRRLNAGYSANLDSFADFPVVEVSEGTGVIVRNGRESVEDVKFSVITANSEFPTGSDGITTPGTVLKAIDEMAQQFARKHSEEVYKMIDKVIDDSGNLVEASPGDLARAFNDALELMFIPFDKNGEPILPSLVCSPKIFEAISRSDEESSQTTAERHRREAIIEKKKLEFRASESNRRLVN